MSSCSLREHSNSSSPAGGGKGLLWSLPSLLAVSSLPQLLSQVSANVSLPLFSFGVQRFLMGLCISVCAPAAAGPGKLVVMQLHSSNSQGTKWLWKS